MPTVLLVDDERMSNRLIKMSLELDGFRVETARSLDEARGKLTADTQAVMVDYHLPQNTTGIDLIQEIRSGETATNTNAAVILASGDDRRKQEALESGADRFLSKPFLPSDLAKLLNALIAEKGL
ncbi:MAG: response regulator [Sphaerospermopsis sp. SIO1G2]|nr:response regulator [Sphaerospermopsis sp. SIO1G2]